MELAFLSFSIKLVFLEATEDLMDLITMFVRVIRGDQNIVEVYAYADVSEVGENVIHELLEGSQCVTETKRHDQVFERSKTSAECNFSFISRGYVDQVISCLKVNLGKNMGLGSAIQQSGDERDRVTVFLGDFVEALIVNTQMK
jgi:hypothetical protein